MGFVRAEITTRFGPFTMACSDEAGTGQDFVLIHGEVETRGSVLTRIQSECTTGHILHSLMCDCGDQLDTALEAIVANGSGLLIYLRQEGRGIGLPGKLRSYALQQERGLDTVDANTELGFAADARSYALAAEMALALDVRSIRLITNNPAKADALRHAGITVEELVSLPTAVRPANRKYLDALRNRFGHSIEI